MYVYILKCSDGSLYTGWTNDLEKRLKTHQAGKASKYTRVRLPVELAFSKECVSAREARQEEYRIKQLGRKEKLKLLNL